MIPANEVNARGGLRPVPRGLPWAATAALAGAILALAAAARLAEVLGEGPGAMLRGAVDTAASAADRPTLLYLYQRADCARHAGLQRRWADLGASGLVSVVGVPLDSPPPGASRSGRTPGPRPSFPVRTDLRRSGARLARRLGFATTPVTILLDGRGRPRLALPPPLPDSGSVAAAEAAVRAAVAAMS